MDDEEVIFSKEHSSQKHLTETICKPMIGFIRNVCDTRENIILEHISRNNYLTEGSTSNPFIKIKVVCVHEVIGVDCYSVYLTMFGWMQTPYTCNKWNLGIYTDYIRNIPYMPKSVLDMILTIQLQNNDIHNGSIYIQATVPLAKFKKQIVDKLNEDPTYHELSGMNIVHELQQLKIENEKHHKTKQKYKTKLSEMKLTIQELQEDMKIIFAKTSEIHQVNIQLTKLLHQEKEKTKQLSTTIQESQCLSFTQANTIGQALMGNSDIFNCM